MSKGAGSHPEGAGAIDVEAMCLAAMDMLDAHLPMIAATLATTERLVEGASSAAAATEELRDHVFGLVEAGRDVAHRLGRGADMALHLLAEGPGNLAGGHSTELRRELLDRVAELGGLSAKLPIAQMQLARIA